jgi:hypothetical protein
LFEFKKIIIKALITKFNFLSIRFNLNKIMDKIPQHSFFVKDLIDQGLKESSK